MPWVSPFLIWGIWVLTIYFSRSSWSSLFISQARSFPCIFQGLKVFMLSFLGGLQYLHLSTPGLWVQSSVLWKTKVHLFLFLQGLAYLLLSSYGLDSLHFNLPKTGVPLCLPEHWRHLVCLHEDWGVVPSIILVPGSPGFILFFAKVGVLPSAFLWAGCLPTLSSWGLCFLALCSTKSWRSSLLSFLGLCVYPSILLRAKAHPLYLYKDWTTPIHSPVGWVFLLSSFKGRTSFFVLQKVRVLSFIFMRFWGFLLLLF